MWLLDLFQIYEIASKPEKVIQKVTCALTPDLCMFTALMTNSHDITLDDPERFQVYMGHIPGGASVKQLNHYS